MPQISRGQIVSQDPQREMFEYVSETANRAVQLVQNRKRLELAEQEIQQQKLRDLHNALWQLVENDAKTNAAGWRGAFENSRTALAGLYSAMGVPEESVKTMFDSIEASGLSPEVLYRYALSDFLTSDWKQVTPQEVSAGITKVTPELKYPTMAEQVTEQKESTRVPVDERVEHLKNLWSSNLYDYLRESSRSFPREAQKEKPAIYRGRGRQEIQIRPAQEFNPEAAKAAFLDNLWDRLKQAPGYEKSQAAYDQIYQEFKDEIAPQISIESPPEGYLDVNPQARQQELATLMKMGVEEERLEVETTVRPRPATPEERRTYRETLAEAGKLPSSVRKVIVEKGLDYDSAVDEWIETGSMTSKQKAVVQQHHVAMNKALEVPEFRSRLRQEYQTPDASGFTKLQKVVMNLGRMQLGMGANPMQLYRAGAQQLMAIIHPEALQAQANQMKARLAAEEWRANKENGVVVTMPDGQERRLNFNQWYQYMDAMMGYYQMMARVSGVGGSEDFLDPNLLKYVQELNKIEQDAGIDPGDEDYHRKISWLASKNSNYLALRTMALRYLNTILPVRDPETGEIIIPEGEKVRQILLRGLFGQGRLKAYDAPSLAGGFVEGGQQYAVPGGFRPRRYQPVEEAPETEAGERALTERPEFEEESSSFLEKYNFTPYGGGE